MPSPALTGVRRRHKTALNLGSEARRGPAPFPAGSVAARRASQPARSGQLQEKLEPSPPLLHCWPVAQFPGKELSLAWTAWKVRVTVALPPW